MWPGRPTSRGRNTTTNWVQERQEDYAYDPELDYLTWVGYDDVSGGGYEAQTTWTYDAAGNRGQVAPQGEGSLFRLPRHLVGVRIGDGGLLPPILRLRLDPGPALGEGPRGHPDKLRWLPDTRDTEAMGATRR